MNSIYLKLAISNIKKNKSTFFPFGLSCGTMIALFYMLLSINNQASDAVFYGGSDIGIILGLGVWVCGIFSAMVIFYTNGFLLKRRNKELGLYNILGMEKKHIGNILFWEIILTCGISMLAGLLGGMLFSKLLFLVLLNLINLSTTINFGISANAVIMTMLVFLSIFIVNIVYNNLKIRRLKPIELLQGSNVGEREPKAKWILALLGAVCLSIGYYIAVTTQNPLQAMSVFFVAVLFVMAGTYLLFISGSIVLLKMLKKNKKYYYHKTHFITVSGMMYRMKQNAVGLANICILSTAVLVVLSSTVSLYMGMDNVMRTRYPSDVITSYAYMPEEDAKYNMSYNYDTELIEKTIQNHANKYNVEIQDVNKYYSFSLVGIVDGESFRPITDDISQGMKDMVIFRAMTLDDYKAAAAEGENIKELPGDSLYLLSSDSRYSSMDNFTVGENVFKIDSASQTMELDNKFAEQTFAYDYIFIIVPDFENLIMVKDEVNNMYREREAQDYGATSVTYNYKFNLSGDLDDKKEFNITLRDALNDADIPHVSTVENIFTTRQQFMELYGSLFFIGIFIGTLFLMATVLIIYYKQVSEGYEDRNRFLIMRNVGMSKKEVRTVIKNQILTIFYLPILLAVVHVAFAFDITRKILAILNLTNVKLFVECTLGTIFIFVIIYGIVYKLTAKSYYKIVNPAN